MSNPVAGRLRRIGLRLLGAAIDDRTLAAHHDSVAGIEDEIRDAVREREVVVIGPWLSEVGFEILYWIPFLRWVRSAFELDPRRVTVVSRGGTGAWYSGIGGRYVDILDLLSVDEFRELTEARTLKTGGQKQSTIGWWDTYVLERLDLKPDGKRIGHLHPSLMYRLFRSCWLGKAPLDTVSSYTRYERLPSIDVAELDGRLPSGPFTAVKFYFRPSFPDTEENRAFIEGVLAALRRRGEVVLLNTGLELDDHPEFVPGETLGALRVLDATAASMNLAAQTAIIERASAFVGTYGGLAYVASAVGTPAVGFFSKQSALVGAHLEVGRRVADALEAPLAALPTSAARLLPFAPSPNGRVEARA